MNISSVASTSTSAAIHTLKVPRINNGVVARDASYNLPGIQGGMPSLKQLALEAFIKGNEPELNQLNGDIEALMNTQLTQLTPSVTIDKLFVKPTVNQEAEALYFHPTLTGFGRILGSPELNVVSISKYEIKTPFNNESLKFTGYAKRDKKFPTIFTPFNEKPDELLEYETKDPNVKLYIREVTCILDTITQQPIYYPTGTGNEKITGNGKIIEKKPNGHIIECEGTWGPKDPTNPQGRWYLTGIGKIIDKKPDGTIIEREGTWGSMDPKNSQGLFHLTGIGKIIETKPDKPSIEREGTWGPMDPTNPQGRWDLTGIGKIIVTTPDGTIVECEGTWGPMDPNNLQGPWCFTGTGKRIEKKPDGTIIEREGTWGPKDPNNLQGPWVLFAQNKDSKKRKRE